MKTLRSIVALSALSLFLYGCATTPSGDDTSATTDTAAPVVEAEASVVVPAE